MEVSLPPRRRLIGFLATDPIETQRVLATCEPLLQEPFGLGVGLLVSPQLLRDGLSSIKHPWRNLMPAQREARSIGAFTTSRICPLILHARVTDQPSTEGTIEEVQAMFNYIGHVPDVLHIEYDFHWPDPLVFDRLHDRHPDLRFIAQIGTLTQTRHKNHPEAYIDQLIDRYGSRLGCSGGPITHLLWDGCGRRWASTLDSQEALRFISTLRTRCDGLEPMISGNFSPDDLSSLEAVCSKTVDFSLETQGRITTFGTRPSAERTVAYIQGALQRLVPS